MVKEQEEDLACSKNYRAPVYCEVHQRLPSIEESVDRPTLFCVLAVNTSVCVVDVKPSSSSLLCVL